MREVSDADKKCGVKVRHLAFRSILRPFFGQKRRKFPDHPAANLQITSAASRFWSHVFSNQCSIPNIRVDCQLPKRLAVSYRKVGHEPPLPEEGDKARQKAFRNFCVAFCVDYRELLIIAKILLPLTPRPTASNVVIVPSPVPPARDPGSAMRMPERSTVGSLMPVLRRAGIPQSPRKHTRPVPLCPFPMLQGVLVAEPAPPSCAAKNAGFGPHTTRQSVSRAPSRTPSR